MMSVPGCKYKMIGITKTLIVHLIGQLLCHQSAFIAALVPTGTKLGV